MEKTANTKIGKIKKLAKLSQNIIHTYGWAYFSRIAIEELKKQKFKLFLSDKNPDAFPTIINRRSNLDNYLSWKQHTQDNFDNKSLIEKEINNLENTPKFCFIFLLKNSDSIAALTKSTKSILNQTYKNWELIIIHNNINLNKKFTQSASSLLKNSQIISKNIEPNAESINKIITEITGDFLIFVNCHMILNNNALFQITKILNQNSETDIIYSDEDKIDKKGKITSFFFKPDWCPYLFLNMNYIGTFFAIRKKIFTEVGGLKKKLDHNDLYDLLIRSSEVSGKISHIPIPLCTFLENSIISSEDKNCDPQIVLDAFKRRGINGTVENGLSSSTLRLKFSLGSQPKISIIIPTKDNKKLLSRCLRSIKKNTSYKNLEIIIVDNNSTQETKSYLSSLPYKILNYDSQFNFSKINNLAAKHASGDYLLFLNDDTEALDRNWLIEMISLCHQKDVGIVGAKLVHYNNVIQHAGMLFLKNGFAFHPYSNLHADDDSNFNFLNIIREYSAVTAACLLIKKNLFFEVGMFDEKFDLYYGDSDLCFKIKKLGFNVLYTPHAKLLHHGSQRTKQLTPSVFAVENYCDFIEKWPMLKKGDPCYNPNFDIDFNVEI